MENIYYLWLFGFVCFYLLAGTGTVDDAQPGDRVRPVSGKVKICRGTVVGSRWCDQGDGAVKDLTTGRIWIQRGA